METDSWMWLKKFFFNSCKDRCFAVTLHYLVDGVEVPSSAHAVGATNVYVENSSIS